MPGVTLGVDHRYVPLARKQFERDMVTTRSGGLRVGDAVCRRDQRVGEAVDDQLLDADREQCKRRRCTVVFANRLGQATAEPPSGATSEICISDHDKIKDPSQANGETRT